MSDYTHMDEASLRSLLDIAASYEERRKIRAAIRDAKKGIRRPGGESGSSGDRRKSVTRSMTITGEAGPRRPSVVPERRGSFAERRGSLAGAGRRGSIFTPETAQEMKETIRRNSVINQYEGIRDESVLSKLLKEATELDERMKIRAALRKLRDVHVDKTGGPNGAAQNPDPLHGFRKEGSNIGRSHSVRSRDHYSQIKDEKVLENLLNSTNDYFERKKIRSALGNLREKGSEDNNVSGNFSDEPQNDVLPQSSALRVPPTGASPSEPSRELTHHQPVFSQEKSRPPTAETLVQPPRPALHLKRTQSLKLSSFGRRTPLDIIGDAIRMASSGSVNGKLPENSVVTQHRPIIMDAKDAAPAQLEKDNERENNTESAGNIDKEQGNNTESCESGGYKWDITNYDQEEEEENTEEEGAADVESSDSGETYLEDVQDKMKEIEKKIDSCKVFDERRELRAQLRELRAQIREGKFKPKPPGLYKKAKEKNPGLASKTSEGSIDLSGPLGEGETRRVELAQDTPLSNGGVRRVKMSVVKSRTPSQSDYTVNDTTVETETPAPGGSKLIEQQKTVTKTKLSKRGSDYYERAQNTTRSVECGEGGVVQETEVRVEQDSASVTSGQQTSQLAELKFVAIDNTVKLATVTDSGEEEETSDEESEQESIYAEITRPLVDAEVLDGTGAVLECGVRLSSGSVAWYHDNALLPPSEEFVQTFDGETARLRITEVFPDDAGEYRCVARSQDGEAQTTARLTVLPNADLIAPVFSRPLGECQAQDGDQVVLACCVSGTPAPTVTWYREDILLTQSGDFQQTYDPETGEAILSISEVFPDDAGMYACVARSPAGEARSQCSLTVAALPPEKLQAPRFVRELCDLEAGEREKVTLECEVAGSKPLEIRWFREGVAIRRSPEFRQKFDGRVASLVITEPYTEDSGVYRCQVKNAAGSVQSSGNLSITAQGLPEIVPGTPTFIRTLRSVVALDGEPATLECQVMADPSPIIIWYKNGKILRAGVEFRQSYDGLRAVLEITEVFPDDQGTYECVARNDHGKCSSKTTLLVKDKDNLLSCDEDLKIQDNDMSDKNIDSIEDEDELHKMLNETEDFEERKKIRARIREVGKKQAAAYEARKAQFVSGGEDAVAMRQRHAEAARQKRLQVMADADKTTRNATSAEDYKREKYAQLEAEKQKKIQDMNRLGSEMSKMYNTDTTDVLKEAQDKKSEEDAVFRSTKTETGEDGSKLTTTTTTSKQTTKDGSTVTTKQTKTVTQVSGLGGTSYKVTKTSAEDTAKRLADTFTQNASEGTSGVIKVRTESWSSKDGVTNRSEKTKTWGGTASKSSGPRGAREAFKQLDSAGDGGGKKVTIERSPSSIKQMLLDWCAHQVREYPNVNITNFSSSWNDGIAFCALIHRFYPKCFDFKKLNPKARRANFKLAFTVAEKEGGIAPLLEVEDMVRMKNPDWKCVFTYVQMFYRKFREWDDSKTLEENQAAVKDKF